MGFLNGSQVHRASFILMLLVFNWSVSQPLYQTHLGCPGNPSPPPTPSHYYPISSCGFLLFLCVITCSKPQESRNILFLQCRRGRLLWGQYSGNFPEMALTPHCCLFAFHTSGRGKNKHYNCTAACVFRVPVSPAVCELWIDFTVPLVFPSVPKLSPCVPRQRHSHV